jgi:hypothetical protein
MNWQKKKLSNRLGIPTEYIKSKTFFVFKAYLNYSNSYREENRRGRTFAGSNPVALPERRRLLLSRLRLHSSFLTNVPCAVNVNGTKRVVRA